MGSVAGLTGVAFAMMLAGGMNVFLAVALALLLGLIIGLVNGLAINRLGIPAFIVTLAGLQGFRGLTMLISGGMTVSGIPPSLGLISNTAILGVPTMFVVMLGFAVRLSVPAGADPARPLHVHARQQYRGGPAGRHQRDRR